MSEFKKQYMPLAVQTAQKYGLDPVMFAAQIEQESGWNPNAKSSAGARGLGQIMPGTARMLKVDPSDPVASIDAAARYMVQLRDKFGSEDIARQAYNAGPGTMQKVLAGKAQLPKETANYNPAIAKRAEKLSKELGIPVGAAVAAAQPNKDTVAAEPAKAAGEPGAPRRPRVADAATQALQDMNAGVPSTPLQAQAPEMQSQGADWQTALASLTGRPQPAATLPTGGLEFDMLASLEDAAAKDQDRVLASMFGDMQGPAKEDTSLLPASVDRYLDKLLA